MRSRLLLSAFLALLLFGCGGNSSGGGNQPPPPPTPAVVAGQWEFVAVSTLNPGATYPDTLVEANLSQTDTTVSAGTAATSLVPFYSNQGGYGVELPVQNVCGGAGETISATVSGQNFSFTLIEAGPSGTYTVTGTATVNSNGQVMTGTYTSAAACGFPNDAGNLTGTLIASISGTYLITFSDGSTSNATVTEDANHNVTVSGIAQGQAYALTGEAVGGGVMVSGDIPEFGQDAYYGAYLTNQLVGLFPVVNNISTAQGDFIFVNSEGNIGLVQPQ
jgi:hypothetical protein